jgi:hypothetical protein
MVFLPPKHVAQVIFFQRVINTISLLILRNVLSALTSFTLFGCHPASFFRIWHGNKCTAVGHSCCGLTHILRILKTTTSVWGKENCIPDRGFLSYIPIHNSESQCTRLAEYSVVQRLLHCECLVKSAKVRMIQTS